MASGLNLFPVPNRNHTTIDLIGGILCEICNSIFGNKKDFDSHYSKHNTGAEEITYTCVVCRLSSTSYPSFRNHCYTSHVNKGRYKCDKCKKTFSKQSALKDHIEVIHNFKCNKSGCNKRFPTKKDLQIHQILHKDDVNRPPFKCQTCGEEFENIPSCENHIDKHYTVTYSCPLCDDNLNKENAYKHLMNHFGVVIADIAASTDIEETPEDSSINIVGGILCCYCDTLFQNRIEIDTHFANKHPDNDVLYTCVICHKPYKKYSLYGDHCYSHCAKQRFVCDVCDRKFPRLSLLVSHAEVHKVDIPYHDTQNNAAFRCRLCHLLLFDALAALRHLSVHRRNRFPCPVCAREYAEKYSLMRHVSQHFEAILHACDICGKAFEAKKRLKEHVRTHSGVRNYKCKYCGKGFLKPYQLSQHLNVHTRARPYACASCPKTFNSCSNYLKHVRKMHKNIDPKLSHVNAHTEARPYACVSCPKTFATDPYLKKHVRRMHNVVPKRSQHVNVHIGRLYACVSCAKNFTTYPKLEKHVRRIHNIDPRTLSKTQFDIKLKTVEKLESEAETLEAKETFYFPDDTMESVNKDSTNVKKEAITYEFELKSLETSDDRIAELSQDIDKSVSKILDKTGSLRTSRTNKA